MYTKTCTQTQMFHKVSIGEERSKSLGANILKFENSINCCYFFLYDMEAIQMHWKKILPGKQSSIIKILEVSIGIENWLSTNENERGIKKRQKKHRILLITLGLLPMLLLGGLSVK